MTDTEPQTANPYLNQEEAAPNAQQAAPVAAASSRTAAMIEMVDRLIEILTVENEMLDRPRSKELGPVVAKKQALFTEYEEMVRRIGNFSELMAETPPDQRTVLLDKAKLFDGLLRENELRLDALVRTSEHIMKVMSNVARKMAQPVQGYGRGGGVTDAPKAIAPVAVNRTF